MTEPTRWRSDPSRQAAADLLLRAVRRPRPPSPGDFARLSSVVCDIPRRAALRRRLVARAVGRHGRPRALGDARHQRVGVASSGGRFSRGRARPGRMQSGRRAAGHRPLERAADGGHPVAYRRPQAVAAASTQGSGKAHAPGAAAVATRCDGPVGARDRAHRRRARWHCRRSERGARETGRPSARISPRPARSGERVPCGGGTPQVESHRRGARTGPRPREELPVELLWRPRNYDPRGHALSWWFAVPSPGGRS